MLARVQIAYSAKEVVDKLSREDYDFLYENVWGLRLPAWTGDDNPNSWYGYGDDCLVDLASEGPILARFGIEFSVKKFKGTYHAAGTDAKGDTINLTVAVPNIGLLSVNEVDWIEDACTQDLQRRLDDGWRILAVCPPNGARRPDYILCRTREAI